MSASAQLSGASQASQVWISVSCAAVMQEPVTGMLPPRLPQRHDWVGSTSGEVGADEPVTR